MMHDFTEALRQCLEKARAERRAEAEARSLAEASESWALGAIRDIDHLLEVFPALIERRGDDLFELVIVTGADICISSASIVTMNDTDLLLEATTEHLLKGKE